MKVGVYYSNSDVRVEQLPVPQIGPGEFLLRVEASGICGSDVLEWYRKKTAPRVLGHEVAGTVERVGPDVSGIYEGDRVFVSHHVPCNSCKYCLAGQHTACETLHSTNFDPGGFAQFVRVPQLQADRGTFKLPDGMSCEQAVFIEPLACVLRAQRLCRIGPGRSILVLGAGVSGLLHLLLARARGAGPVAAVDPDAKRRDAAIRFGANAAVEPVGDLAESLADTCGTAKFDTVVVCTGALSAFEAAFRLVDRAGVVCAFATPSPGQAVQLELSRFWRSGLSLVTSYAAAPSDLAEALSLIDSGIIPVDGLITHRLPLDRIQEGFQLVCKGGEALKVIILPQAAE
ncbi:MAG: alcohol dehydrogenase [Deltaproteobacteria bacterium]|nr:MAG: alcohol dehydrogenase [Deltaproteobacteria bacterium]